MNAGERTALESDLSASRARLAVFIVESDAKIREHLVAIVRAAGWQPTAFLGRPRNSLRIPARGCLGAFCWISIFPDPPVGSCSSCLPSEQEYPSSGVEAQLPRTRGLARPL